MREGTAFSNIIAAVALAVSLASASWSIYAFAMSSEVRVLPFDEVVIMNDASVPQLKLDVTMANLAYGEFDDVAQVQEVILDVGGRQLRFLAVRHGAVRLLTQNVDGSYSAPPPACYLGGVGLLVCPTSEHPVTSLEAGKITTASPLFELAEDDCGLDACQGVTLAQLSPLLEGTVRLSYRVQTMRDGVREQTCSFALTESDIGYLNEIGWTNPRCGDAA